MNIPLLSISPGGCSSCRLPYRPSWTLHFWHKLLITSQSIALHALARACYKTLSLRIMPVLTINSHIPGFLQDLLRTQYASSSHPHMPKRFRVFLDDWIHPRAMWHGKLTIMPWIGIYIMWDVVNSLVSIFPTFLRQWMRKLFQIRFFANVCRIHIKSNMWNWPPNRSHNLLNNFQKLEFI